MKSIRNLRLAVIGIVMMMPLILLPRPTNPPLPAVVGWNSILNCPSCEPKNLGFLIIQVR